MYVDWIEDPSLDRENVTVATAELLRRRMRKCASLFFATSEAASSSKWMPWELGYFDAHKGRVAIVPVSDSEKPGNSWKGREYLGLYPYVTRDQNTLHKLTLWIHDSEKTYVSFGEWVKGKGPYART